MHAWLLCSAFEFVPGNEDNTSCNTDMNMYCMGEVGPFSEHDKLDHYKQYVQTH
jgi:hypothetical protein